MNPSSQSKQSFADIFHAFTGGAKDMDGRQFVKLAKDCSLLDKKVTTTDIDLIFAKVKDKSVRKITFAQFQQALDLIATKKGTTKEDIIKQIEMTGGPHFHGTKAENVRLHDDKSTYTGVYAQGGPTTVDQKPSSLSNF